MLLIREGPATELTVATRILAHLGLLAEGARVAALVGTEVVYLAGAGVNALTMTPYDVTAVRLVDGLALTGRPPADVGAYLGTLRSEAGAAAVTRTPDGSMPTAETVAELIERITGLTWADAESRARAAGALVGAYAAEPSG